MRKLRTAVLATAGTLLAATGAMAATAELHSMTVDLPDGAVAHIRYAGDLAPQVTVLPADARTIALVDPFAGMDAAFADLERVSAMMRQQSLAMVRRAAQLQRDAAPDAMPGTIAVSSDLPAGSYHYSFVSTSTTSNGNCTRTVEWRSDGSDRQPQVTRASSGDCDSVQRGQTIVPAAAQQPQPTAADSRTI
jgi:hypothetical protein